MATTKRKDSKGRVLPDGFTERKDGRYAYRYVVNGQRKSLYDSDLQGLKNKVQQLRHNMEYGVDKIETISLSVWFSRYMEEYKRAELKPTTYARDLGLFESHIKHTEIENMKLSEIKPIHIQNVVNGMYADYSRATIKEVRRVLNGCFQKAVENRMIVYNPVDNVYIKGGKEKQEKNIFESAEVQNDFLRFIATNNTYKFYLPLFFTMVFTGARIGEILALTWSDIDFKEMTIDINKTLAYKNIGDGKGTHFFISEPKTKASKSKIPMMAKLKKYLILQKENQFNQGICADYVIDGYKGFVFTSKSGKPYTNANINRIIKESIDAYNDYEKEKAEKERRQANCIEHLSAHSFRHNLATRLCESTDNIKAIQGILRHANADVTMNTYAKVTENGKRDAIQELEKVINL